MMSDGYNPVGIKSVLKKMMDLYENNLHKYKTSASLMISQIYYHGLTVLKFNL